MPTQVRIGGDNVSLGVGNDNPKYSIDIGKEAGDNLTNGIALSDNGGNPIAPPDGQCVLYMKKNQGRHQLLVRFPKGGVKSLALEDA